MKFGPVTKHDKRENTPYKQFDGDAMPENCNIIVPFSVYDQFGAIWKSDSGRIVCKTYIFIKSNLLSHKICEQN